ILDRQVVVRDRLVILLAFSVELADAVVRLGVPGVALQGLLIILQERILNLIVVDQGAIAVVERVARLEADGLVVGLNGIRVFLLRVSEKTEAVVGVGIVGQDAQSFVEIGLSLLELLHADVGEAAVAAQIGHTRVEIVLNGVGVVLNGLGVVAPHVVDE